MSVICDICGESFKDTRGLAGHKQFKHAGEREEKTESKAVTRAQPLDNVIENLRLPQVPEAFDGQYNVYVAGFNDGVMHGARSILAGIRAAQELSSMGISQAKPLILMAAEMRQAEGQAAQEMAAQLGQAIHQGNANVINALNSLASQRRPAEADPMAAMVANTIQPYFQQMLGNLMGMVMRPMGAGPIQQQPGQPPAGPGPGSSAPGQQFGFQQASEDEIREAFGNV